jgi:hypothetical protein
MKKCSLISVSRVGITRHDQRAVDGVRLQKTVDDLQCGEDPARSIGHVKREGVGRLCAWFFGGTDVLLDHRRQRRLAQVSAAIDSGIDQQVNVMGVPSGPLQAVLG